MEDTNHEEEFGPNQEHKAEFVATNECALQATWKESLKLSHPHAGLLKPDLDARELLPDDVEHVGVEETEEQRDHESLKHMLVWF